MAESHDAGGSESAYAALRSAIVENRYAPGQRLVEQRLAAELGMSRTPVREAIRRLEAEGLVITEPHRGASVRPVSSADVVDLYGLRSRLESFAAELAAERGTAQELHALADAVAEFGEASRDTDPADIETLRRLAAANRRIHDTIVAAAHHDRLAAMLRRTVDVPLVFRALQQFGPAERERSDVFHRLILEAIRNGHAKRAGALMAEHIAQGLDVVLRDLAETASGETAFTTSSD